MTEPKKIALVTGATRGIGREIALQLAKSGYVVVGTATSEKGANTISESLRQVGAEGCGLVLDVSNSDNVNDVMKTVKAEFGAPLVLINNAGITRDNLLMRMKDEEWDSIINTNLSSVFRMSKACLRGMMKAKEGRIVTIASVVGLSGNAGQANYAAAKAGIIGFTKSLAQEVGSRNITVNAVAPGFIDTDMTRSLPEEQKERLLGSIPLGRLGEVAEIASAVTFLCSPGAAYITGETINVNGGMYMS